MEQCVHWSVSIFPVSEHVSNSNPDRQCYVHSLVTSYLTMKSTYGRRCIGMMSSNTAGAKRELSLLNVCITETLCNPTIWGTRTTFWVWEARLACVYKDCFAQIILSRPLKARQTVAVSCQFQSWFLSNQVSWIRNASVWEFWYSMYVTKEWWSLFLHCFAGFKFARPLLPNSKNFMITGSIK